MTDQNFENCDQMDQAQLSDSDDDDIEYVPTLVRIRQKDSSDVSSEDEDEEEPPEHIVRPLSPPVSKLYGKNNTEWRARPFAAHRSSAVIIRRGYGKPKPTVRPTTPGEAFRLFITTEMVNEIITETNREGARKKETWKPFTELEFWAFLGLVINAGVQKQSDVPIRELFLEPRSDPIFHATMSVNRFEEIRSNMRFDNRDTREERNTEMGKLAPFKKIFDLFIDTLRDPYVPNIQLTLDEQLKGYRGNCPMKQYIASKPDKFGIKIFWVCDAVNGYALNGKIYAGKEGDVVTRDLAAKVTLLIDFL
jgi:hypothetical protein